MIPELDKKLCEDFPTLFKDRHGNPRETGLCFGIEFNEGWEPILRQLCVELVKIDKTIYFSQLKEKFGTMRAYVSGGSSETFDEVRDIIIKYETLSSTICEDCGKPGKVRDDLGWIRTLCQDHYKEACKKIKK